MATRSTEQVKRELESERKGLEHAATTLRTESGTVAKRFGLVAVGITAAVITAKVAARVLRRED